MYEASQKCIRFINKGSKIHHFSTEVSRFFCFSNKTVFLGLKYPRTKIPIHPHDIIYFHITCVRGVGKTIPKQLTSIILFNLICLRTFEVLQKCNLETFLETNWIEAIDKSL